jgi:galactokinase
MNDFKNKYLRLKDGSFFPEPEDGFRLKQRFQYVIEEAFRVDKAKKALAEDKSEVFGKLMNESHKGAKDLYEISCPELDYLVDNALLNGAIGARLTGAGFGGCMISLLKNSDAEDFIEKMKTLYFKNYLPEKHSEILVMDNDLSEKIFVCKPCRGAGFLFE